MFEQGKEVYSTEYGYGYISFVCPKTGDIDVVFDAKDKRGLNKVASYTKEGKRYVSGYEIINNVTLYGSQMQ